MTLATIPAGAIPLAVGTLLALAALAFVLAPLLNNGSESDAPAERAARSGSAPASTGIELSTDVDPVEAAIRRARARQQSCVNCGPRIEPDATYCSNCGTFLPGACTHCHAPVTERSAAFCVDCGDALNAFV